jgi:hypothetical protein
MPLQEIPKLTTNVQARGKVMAEKLREIAQRAEDGELVGYSMLLRYKGKTWDTSGSGEGNSIEAIGQHFLSALDIALALREEESSWSTVTSSPYSSSLP